jgi:hypothetical protein
MYKHEREIARDDKHHGNGLALPNLDQVASLNAQTIAAITEFNGTLLSELTHASKEWTDFVGRRLHEDFELAERLAKCTSPPDVLTAYRDFCRKAWDDYSKEMMALVKIGQSIAEKSVDGFNKHAEGLRTPPGSP